MRNTRGRVLLKDAVRLAVLYTIAVYAPLVLVSPVELATPLALLLVMALSLRLLNPGAALLTSGCVMAACTSARYWALSPILSLLAPLPYLAVVHSGVRALSEHLAIPGRGRFGGATLLLMAASMATLASTIIHLGVLPASIALLSYTVALWSLKSKSLRHVSVETPRIVRVVRGEPIDVELRVVNEAKHSVTALISIGGSELRGVVVQPAEWRAVVEPSTAMTLSVRLIPNLTGLITIPIAVTLLDDLNVACAFEEPELEIHVIPKAKLALEAALRLLARLPPALRRRLVGGLEVAEVRGLPSRRGEYYGVRIYTPGDDVASIHWKKSVSKVKLVVKEFRQAVEAPAVLVADLTSCDYEELDDLVYDLLATLILEVLRGPTSPVAMVVYEADRLLLYRTFMPAASALTEVLVMLKNVALRPREVARATLDSPPRALYKLAARDERALGLLKAELEGLWGFLEKRPGYRPLLRILTCVNPPVKVVVIHGGYVAKHAYTLLKYHLESMGHVVVSPPELPPPRLYEEAMRAPLTLVAPKLTLAWRGVS